MLQARANKAAYCAAFIDHHSAAHSGIKACFDLKAWKRQHHPITPEGIDVRYPPDRRRGSIIEFDVVLAVRAFSNFDFGLAITKADNCLTNRRREDSHARLFPYDLLILDS